VKFLLSNCFKGLKMLLFLCVSYIFLLIVNIAFGKYFLKELFPTYEIFLWLLAGVIYNFFYYRFRNFKKPFFVAALLIIMLLKYNDGYYSLTFAFLSFIFGLWQDSWKLSHYELMAKLKKFTLFILFCLLIYRDGEKAGEMLFLTFSFIMVSLATLSIYHLEPLSSQISKKRWLLTTLIFCLVIGIFIIMIAELIKPHELLTFINFIKETYFSFVELMFKVLTPLFMPLDKIFTFILSVILKHTKIKRQEILYGEQGESIIPGKQEEYVMPAKIEIIFKTVGFILLLLAFTGVMFMALKKYHRSFNEKNDLKDERESVFAPSIFKNSLSELSSKIGSIIKSCIKLRIYGDFPAAKIRKLYAQILNAAAKKGYFRKSSETPLEFTTQLKKAFQDEENLIEDVTMLYQRARYFPESVSDTDAENMKKITKILMTK